MRTASSPLISMTLAAAIALAAGLPVAAAGMAGSTGPGQSFPAEAPLRLANTDYEKIEKMYRCCLRYVKGQSLSGLYCSRKYLNMAFSRNVVAIVSDGRGGQTCTTTGQPL